jgi:hypothetical protein
MLSKGYLPDVVRGPSDSCDQEIVAPGAFSPGRFTKPLRARVREETK